MRSTECSSCTMESVNPGYGRGMCAPHCELRPVDVQMAKIQLRWNERRMRARALALLRPRGRADGGHADHLRVHVGVRPGPTSTAAASPPARAADGGGEPPLQLLPLMCSMCRRRSCHLFLPEREGRRGCDRAPIPPPPPSFARPGDPGQTHTGCDVVNPKRSAHPSPGSIPAPRSSPARGRARPDVPLPPRPSRPAAPISACRASASPPCSAPARISRPRCARETPSPPT